jgi:hypothetical protein
MLLIIRHFPNVDSKGLQDGVRGLPSTLNLGILPHLLRAAHLTLNFLLKPPH